MINIKDYEKGFVLFAMPYECKADIECAKEYCVENGLTPDDVKIVITEKKEEKLQLLLVKVK